MQALFDHVAARLLAEDPTVERGRMLRSFGLRTAGSFFAFVRDGELVLKLPAQRVGELVEGGSGRPFDRGDGKPLKEWVCVAPVDDGECLAYVEEARRFALIRAAGVGTVRSRSSRATETSLSEASE